jgi:pyridoxal phosphate enzyme (YggS family)
MLIAPQNSPAATDVAVNLAALRAQIAAAAREAGRSEDCITLLAVSKGHAAAQVRAAAAAGLRHFGESYVDEALPKIQALRDLGLSWHFIGRLQANKTRSIAQHFDWVHGIDRLKIAERLSAQRPHFAPPLEVCLQVNIAAEAQKAGVDPEQAGALALAVHALPHLRLRGLMCILPAGRGTGADLHDFHALHALQLQINRQHLALDTLSMGMSGDFREAIAAGSTLIRIGTALFGPRS